MTSNHRTEFRNKLLFQTVEHARRNVPAYRNLYRGLSTPSSVSGLSALPIINKELMRCELEDFRDPSLTTQIIQHTTGTTAEPLIIHRSDDEIEFIKNFHLTALQLRGNQNRTNPIVISVLGNFHGQGIPFPYPGNVLPVDPRDQYWNIRNIIANPSSFVGSDSNEAILVGLEPLIRLLTCQLLENGFDFSTSKVKAISCTGDLITRRSRSWYETVWGVKLFDRYSMTEMIGTAETCDYCGFRHLDPTVIGEVVDPITKEAVVSTGYGVLVITNLYPFVQQQPFIRYWTGDLIRLGPQCDVDTLGFELEGRVRTCVLDVTGDGASPLISGARIYDVLDDFPDINSTVMFSESKDVSDHTALGKLRFSLASSYKDDVLNIDVIVETRYPPYQHSERVNWLCSEVQARLLERHPRLRMLLEAGKVTLRCSAVSRGKAHAFLPDWVE